MSYKVTTFFATTSELIKEKFLPRQKMRYAPEETTFFDKPLETSNKNTDNLLRFEFLLVKRRTIKSRQYPHVQEGFEDYYYLDIWFQMEKIM